jgi:hypothetical protein
MTVIRQAIYLTCGTDFESCISMGKDKKAIIKLPVTGSVDHFEDAPIEQ